MVGECDDRVPELELIMARQTENYRSGCSGRAGTVRFGGTVVAGGGAAGPGNAVPMGAFHGFDEAGVVAGVCGCCPGAPTGAISGPRGPNASNWFAPPGTNGGGMTNPDAAAPIAPQVVVLEEGLPGGRNCVTFVLKRRRAPKR
jgi:hypothetical protein